MKRFTLACALLGALIASLAVGLTTAAPASAAPANGGLTAPSTLPIAGNIVGGGTFTGTLSNLQFVNQGGALAVTGNLTGTLTNAAGTVIGTVNNGPITASDRGCSGGNSCQILDLTLGPLDLDLLGLHGAPRHGPPEYHGAARPGQPAREPALRGRRPARWWPAAVPCELLNTLLGL